VTVNLINLVALFFLATATAISRFVQMVVNCIEGTTTTATRMKEQQPQREQEKSRAQHYMR
jgi:hypothetical protein